MKLGFFWEGGREASLGVHTCATPNWMQPSLSHVPSERRFSALWDGCCSSLGATLSSGDTRLPTAAASTCGKQLAASNVAAAMRPPYLVILASPSIFSLLFLFLCLAVVEWVRRQC